MNSDWGKDTTLTKEESEKLLQADHLPDDEQAYEIPERIPPVSLREDPV